MNIMESKIQLIAYPPISGNFGKIKISFIDQYDSLDSYKFNIINLSNSKLWRYHEFGHTFKDDSNILTLIQSIGDVLSSMVIVTLSKNFNFKITNIDGIIHESSLKNELNIIYQFLNQYFDLKDFNLVYGHNQTEIDDCKFDSEFYIKTNNPDYKIITRNVEGKTTTIQKDNFVFTTLELPNSLKIIKFLNKTLADEKIDSIPDWFDEIEMFDDKVQKQRIMSNDEEINRLKEDNDKAYEILKNNNEFKSILYKQSKPLVKTVFKILEDMLDYDLSNFKDKFKEDFLIKLEDVTFIGEIKGVSSNAKRKHLSQTDDHVSEREDLLEEKGVTENIKPLLIINRFIDLPPLERPDVDQTTIIKAEEKFGTLIITTEELLKLYETYKNNEIDTEEIIKRFKNEIGLFEL